MDSNSKCRRSRNNSDHNNNRHKYTHTNTGKKSRRSAEGGSVTPANPPSNISNGTLGVFSAHATATKAIVIK